MVSEIVNIVSIFGTSDYRPDLWVAIRARTRGTMPWYAFLPRV